MYIKFEISSNFSWQILGRLLSCCPERPVYFIYAADQTQDTSSYLLQTRQDTCTLYFAQILVHESFWSGPFNAFIAAHWPLFGTLCYLRMLWTHVPNLANRIIKSYFTKILIWTHPWSKRLEISGDVQAVNLWKTPEIIFTQISSLRKFACTVRRFLSISAN